MTYLTEKQEGYRQSVVIVEIDLDINDTNIDFSGDPDSYNTPKTTIDPAAQVNIETQTYIFTNQELELGVTHYPIINSVSQAPAILKPGEDVSASASATVTLFDVESNDVFELPPPYEDRRVTASFLGKLLARNFLNNRDVRIKRGYNPKSLDDDNFQIEHYVVKSVGAIDSSGNLTIELIDRLFFSSETKAKAPQNTDVTLDGDITNIVTTLNFDGTNFGDKSKDYTIQVADVGIIVINNELMEYTVASYSAGSGSLTITRGFDDTDNVAHTTGATIQGCFITESAVDVFGAQNITDINRRLLNNFTDLGSGFIDDADWDAEKAGDLANYNFTNIITKPTEVRKLIKETIQSSGSWMYFDIILNELTIGASARFDEPVSTLTEDTNILQNSMKVVPQSNLQVTRSTIRYNKLDYTQGDDKRYYGNSFQKIDSNVESDAQSRQQSEAKEIKSNWYTGSTTDASVANSIPQLKVERFNTVPTRFTFNLDSKDVGDLPSTERLWYGSVVDVETRQLLNPDASIATSTAQVLSIKALQLNDTWQITALSYNANIPTNVDLYIDVDKVDYLLTDELVTTEAREYIVVINSAIRITSSSTSEIAFDTGVLFAGATLKLINQGYIVGPGGDGGKGALWEDPGPEVPETDGLDGGDALNLQVDTTLDNLSGLIGGGGGGGTGGIVFDTIPKSVGGGGGGGAGDIGGIGGDDGEGLSDPPFVGEDGSFNFPGEGGEEQGVAAAGEDGGDLGEDTSGSTAGNAINKNGNSLTILSGDNEDQIKGDVV